MKDYVIKSVRYQFLFLVFGVWLQLTDGQEWLLFGRICKVLFCFMLMNKKIRVWSYIIFVWLDYFLVGIEDTVGCNAHNVLSFLMRSLCYNDLQWFFLGWCCLCWIRDEMKLKGGWFCDWLIVSVVFYTSLYVIWWLVIRWIRGTIIKWISACLMLGYLLWVSARWWTHGCWKLSHINKLGFRGMKLVAEIYFGPGQKYWSSFIGVDWNFRNNLLLMWLNLMDKI